MESICEGWLIKSPPEKRTQSRWKLFRAKWRRRYFVLYAPPAVDIIPGMCAAILDYFGGKNLRHKHGTIDLTCCEEVLSQLDATFYQNVFGLRTKHKNRDRTYYLVAETEAEMNEWVNSLCFVLGMKENVQDSSSSSTSGLGLLPQPPRVALPSPTTSSLFSSVCSLPAPRSETLPFPNRMGRRTHSHTRVQSLPGINEASNTEAEEWQTHMPISTRLRLPPPSAPPMVGTRDNHMALRFVPPLTNSGQRHSCVLSAMSDRPQVFADLPLSEQATNNSSHGNSTHYDHPRQSYYHKIPSCDENSNNFSGISPKLSDGLYSVPNRGVARALEQDYLYKIPPSRSNNFLYSDDVRYDVPASARQSYDVPAKCTEQHTVNGEHYDVPPSGIPVPRLSSSCQSDGGKNDDLSEDTVESSHLLSVLQNLINELPSLDSSENHLVKPSGYCNWDSQSSGTLEGKISPRELLSLSPPVPTANNVPQHSYINTSTGNEETPSVDTSAVGVESENNYLRPLRLPRHPAYNQVPTATDPICFTYRSRSFKRTIECTDNNRPLCLPMRRISDADETSSISDDEESSSISNSNCSSEPSTPLKPSIYDIVPLPTQKDRGCHPAISKESEMIKYLDLDLETNPAGEKPCSPGKFSEVLDSKRGVQYKEIDWCKTKALTETRREVENKRRTGERILGD